MLTVIAGFIVGYITASLTLDWVRLKFNGVETQIRAFEDKIKALKAKL